MARHRSSSPPGVILRTFIAIELDPAIATALRELQDDMRRLLPQRLVRWVRPEGIHLTLKFLGDTPADRQAEIERALTAAAAEAPPCSLAVQGLDCFPDRRRPRVIWVGISEPTGRLRALWRSIGENMSVLGWPAEKRGFQPHLTLGRVQRHASPVDRRGIGEAVGRANVGWLGGMDVQAVSFIKSDLRPTGAVYATLAEVSLRGPR